MQLPPELRDQLEQIAARFPLRDLRAATERLSSDYREGKRAGFASDVERVAYLLTRFPATYAACSAALSKVREVVPFLEIRSVLDLGSGPGTAIAAAARIFPTVARVRTIESDEAIAMIPDSVLASTAIERSIQDLNAARFDAAELVTLSYVLGEVQAARRAEIIEKAWTAAQELLLVIEPGTPEGYQRILAVRSQLLAKAGHIVAPCPHEERCPMQGTKDWCHFAARVERSSLHRQLKRGELGHEDEKFSYVAFAREPVKRPRARIVRHPWQKSGLVKLELCVDGETIRTETVTRSAKDQHRLARQARWGDAWPPILKDDER